jgi:hypothetical protein
MEGRGRPASGPLDGAGRRSLYIKVQRNFLSPFMLTFDMPSPFSTMGRRSVSNVPAQSLVLMNDPFVWQQSELWARSLASGPWTTVEQRLDAAFEMALARIPTADQRAALLGYVNERARQQQLSPLELSVWIDVCHALFNMKEFIYLP